MTTNLAELKQAAPAKKPNTFPAMLQAWKGEIAHALPQHLNADRMARIALTEFRKNPKLGECEPQSVFAAVLMASQLGVEPGLMGQAYLIPYGKECQLQVGYQGLLDLVRRAGMVKSIEAHVVYERDKFTYKTGLETVLEHEPYLDGERGEMRLAYAVAQLTDGGHHVEVMSRAQIEKNRDRSQNVRNAAKWNKQTPWDTDTEEMWRKTVIRRIAKYLPKSAELQTAISLEDAAARGRQDITVKDAIEGTWVPVVAEGEADAQEPAARPSEGSNAAGPADKPTQMPAGEGPTEADVLSMLDRAKSLDDLDTAMSLSEPGNKAVLKRYNERKSALTKGARNVE